MCSEGELQAGPPPLLYSAAHGVTGYYPGGRQPISPFTQHPPPPLCPLILVCMGGDGHLVHCGGLAHCCKGLLPGQHLLPAPPVISFSPAATPVASPQENDLHDVPETLVGEKALGHLTPARPPSWYPGLQAEGESQLYPIFISHIVATGKWIPSLQAGLPAASAFIHCLGSPPSRD